MEIAMTLHLDRRMNQRGITRDLLDLTLAHGTWEGDRCVLGKRAIQALLRECDELRRIAVRAMDKGGLVVVEAGGREVTAYSMTSRRSGKR
jgi:hypothetical protein